MTIELLGDTWFGTGGRRLQLADLRGRIVLLDFWTLCCVNCHHVLAELRPIEERYADVLTVIGVHSPKFEHEKNPDAVLAAIHRHGITHPILNDPNMDTWQAYGVRAWPTLVLLDPHGEVAATFSGEGHGHAIAARIAELVERGEADGSLVRGSDVFIAAPDSDAPYIQPGKAIILRDGRLIVSESGRHRLVIADVQEPNVAAGFLGTGQRGFADGDAPLLNEPYGLTELPADVAQRVGYDVVIADTANHALRGWNLTSNTVTTIAGTGEQWMQGDAIGGAATEVRLSTPWDIAWDGTHIVIAMAGEHRIWKFDPVECTVAVFAGTTNEGLVDGPLHAAWFAQTSAIAFAENTYWIIDSETSALRSIKDGVVRTHVGKGLFDFGHVDGLASDALMQHPLGLALAPDGRVFVADSYNGAVRVFDSERNEMTTLLRGLAEPSDLLIDPAGTRILVVEAAAGRISTHPIVPSDVIKGAVMRSARPGLVVKPGELNLVIRFDPPPGEKRDDRNGPSTHLVISASPPELLVDGSGSGEALDRVLVFNPNVLEGVLHVAAKGASCDSPSADQPYPACHIHQQDWGIPIRIDESGVSELVLPLSG